MAAYKVCVHPINKGSTVADLSVPPLQRRVFSSQEDAERWAHLFNADQELGKPDDEVAVVYPIHGPTPCTLHERIQEIYSRAFKSDDFPSGGEEVCLSVQDLVKLTELIVLECITLGTNFTNRNYTDDAGERIAKHFGVEE